MKIEIIGLKKTKKNFIRRISQISSDISNLKSNLSKLNIFSDITNNKNKIYLTELKNKISINSKGKDKNTLTIIIQNIFGKAENFNININSIKEYEICFSKPFIFGNFLLFSNITNSSFLKKLSNSEYLINTKEFGISHNSFEIGYGLDKYIFMKYNLPNIKFDLKKGLDFTKFTSFFNINLGLSKLLKYDLKLGTGFAIGNIKPVDKFYLGQNIKGYKKDTISPKLDNKKEGGRSYIEMINKLIIDFNKYNLYFFGSVGMNNKEENPLKIFKEYPSYKNSAMGLSVGTGISVPINGKEGINLDLSIAFPLIRDINTDMYQFSFDLGF